MTKKPECDAVTNVVIACLIGAAMVAIAGSMCLFFQSCTYAITMVHTEGSATDVVDEKQDVKADIKPDIAIPVIP